MPDLLTLSTGEVLDVAAYPLPEGMDDETYNREDLADVMKVSTPTINDWVRKGMPVSEIGSNGRSYEFVFSQCYAWRMWRAEQDARDREEKAKRKSEHSSLFLNLEEDEQPATLTAREVREWSEAELVRNKAAEQRKELLAREPVQAVMDTVMVSFRNALLGVPDFLEQEFGLSPRDVAKTQDYCDSILDETRRQITEAGLESGAVVELNAKEGGSLL